jgi:putative cell wall-binding protein
MTSIKTYEGAGARLLAVFAAAALLLTLLPTLAGSASAAHFADNTERVSGDSRYATAAAIAAEAYPDGTDDVVVATDATFADALAGSLLAGGLDAPILITQATQLTGVTAAAIESLGASNVWLLGGEAAISAGVEASVADIDGVENIVRIDGANRYDTARLIAETTFGDDTDNEIGETEGGTTGILAFAGNFPDALAAGPLAFGGLHPLLLTDRDELNAETAEAIASLDLDVILIAGGAAAISEAVEAEVEALGVTTARVSGADRTHTAVAFAELTRDALYGPLTGVADSLAVATGANQRGGADALAIAPLAVALEADLVITGGVDNLDGAPNADGVTQPSTFIREGCEGYGAAATPIQIAGGEAAISEDVENEIKFWATCEDFVVDGGLELTPETATNVIDGENASDTHIVTATGVNAFGEPAEDGVIRFEVYRAVEGGTISDGNSLEDILDGTILDGDNGEFDGSFFVEDGRVFVEVAEDRDNVALDAEGQADFSYTYESDTVEAEDRILACALPDETVESPSDRSCTNDEGQQNPNTPYGEAKAAKFWVLEASLEGEFTVDLLGANEVFFQEDGKTNGLGAAGGDAVGEATLTLTAFEACLSFTLDGVEGTFAGFEEATGLPAVHLHEGPTNSNGPVVLPFTLGAPVQTGDNVVLTDDCVDIDPDLVRETLAEPGDYYINTHTDVFTGGVARAQLDGSTPDVDRRGEPGDEFDAEAAAAAHGDAHGA